MLSDKDIVSALLWGRRKFILWFLLAAILIGAGFWFAPLAAMGALLLFTMFDLVGWEAVQPYYDTDRKLVMAYRILQHTFLLMLFVLTWGLFGWTVAGAWILVWWFGGADILYYWIGQYLLPTATWTWMKWTPLGIIKGDLSTLVVLIQAGVGMFIAILLLILT